MKPSDLKNLVHQAALDVLSDEWTDPQDEDMTKDWADHVGWVIADRANEIRKEKAG